MFAITAKHLSPDFKKSGVDLPEFKVDGISSKKLRGLLDALAKLAPKVAYPAAPELRINSPQSGMCVVKANGGHLEFVSWSSTQRGSGVMTAPQIHAAITGEGVQEDVAPVETDSPRDRSQRKRNVMVSSLLIVAIILVNSFTVWVVFKPKKTLVPSYTLMKPEPAERVLTSASGVYETGGSPGDRQLRIMKDGAVEWIKFGQGRRAADKKAFTVAAASIAGKEALVTSPRKTMIEIKDVSMIVLYGDTYRRILGEKPTMK